MVLSGSLPVRLVLCSGLCSDWEQPAKLNVLIKVPTIAR
jgi:hypothetical protein